MRTGRAARARARGGVRSGFRVEEAYRHIKTRIMSAELPPGATVNEQAIAEALGISRTPVREAIRKLEQEGLVQEAGGQDYESHHRSDLELHRLIFDAAGNATLRQVVEMLNERIVQVRIVNSPGRFQRRSPSTSTPWPPCRPATGRRGRRRCGGTSPTRARASIC